MSYKEFWEDDPEIFWAYRFFYFKKQEIDAEQQNFYAWLNGMYTYNALCIALSNAFKEKGATPDSYVTEPIDIFGAKKKDEKLEKDRIQEERNAQEMKIKERALRIQALLQKSKKGGAKSG